LSGRFALSVDRLYKQLENCVRQTTLHSHASELFSSNRVLSASRQPHSCGLESRSETMAHDWQTDHAPLPSFEQLVDEHQSMVFSIAWRMTGDRGLAEEIAQDVFMELDRNLGKIENAAHCCYWLRRVTMNRSADALRRRKVRGIDLWDEMKDDYGAAAENRESPLSARLEQLLATLPEAQRAALILRYQEDQTPDEIAATLSAPVATVKSHLQRGLKLLRAKAATQLKEYVRGA
jgi:RNA polymerase sigma-70 factor (ECF subfamily)